MVSPEQIVAEALKETHGDDSLRIETGAFQYTVSGLKQNLIEISLKDRPSDKSNPLWCNFFRIGPVDGPVIRVWIRCQFG